MIMDGITADGGGGGENMLIPGLCDEITVERIASKASWRTLCVLAFVDWAWKRAIEERQVYNARKRTQSRQTLLVCALESPTIDSKLVVYDLEQQWKPLLSHLRSFTPKFHYSFGALPVILDDKLYVREDYVHKTHGGRSKLQKGFRVLDLGGCHRTWKPCSGTKFKSYAGYHEPWRSGKHELSMPRDEELQIFVPCDGKLYVFCEGFVNVEVFDPKKDEGSLIVNEPCIAQEYNWAANSRLVCLNNETFVPVYFKE